MFRQSWFWAGCVHVVLLLRQGDRGNIWWCLPCEYRWLEKSRLAAEISFLIVVGHERGRWGGMNRHVGPVKFYSYRKIKNSKTWNICCILCQNQPMLITQLNKILGMYAYMKYVQCTYKTHCSITNLFITCVGLLGKCSTLFIDKQCYRCLYLCVCFC